MKVIHTNVICFLIQKVGLYNNCVVIDVELYLMCKKVVVHISCGRVANSSPFQAFLESSRFLDLSREVPNSIPPSLDPNSKAISIVY